MTNIGILIFFCIFPIINTCICLLFFCKIDKQCLIKHLKSHLIMVPLYWLVGFSVSLLFSIIFVSIAYIGVTPKPDLSTQIEKPIYSLSIINSSDLNKNISFQLGNTDSTYVFLMNNNDHYIMQEVNSKNFKIIYTNAKTPKIIINALEYTIEPRVFNNSLFTTERYKYEHKNWFGIIYIPKGSIITPYK